MTSFGDVPWRYKTEYRKKFRPFSLYQYVDGHFQKPCLDNKVEMEQRSSEKDSWYHEVLELRKKAGEYKVSSYLT